MLFYNYIVLLQCSQNVWRDYNFIVGLIVNENIYG